MAVLRTLCAALFAAATHAAVVCKDNTLATADDYKVCWETDVAQNTITLTLTVRTNGWIGFGIAENTSSWMPGSDIATVEWGAQGEAILTDRYAVDQTAPQADPCGPEEWQMENFQRANGVVTGVLKRKLIITDTQTDRSILPGSQRVILAYGTSAMMGYHSARKSVAFPFVAGGVPEDSTHDKSVDIKSSFVVPSAKTTYSYLGFDLMQQFPEMKTSKHQIVGFQFLAADGGLPYDVHHVVVNACKYPQNFTHGVTLTATEHAMPETGPRCASETQMYLWAPGKDTYFLPKEAGFTVTDIENRYLVLGYHYDNPQGSSGNVDTSGISIKITSTARQHEAGVLGYGDFNVHYRNTLPAVTTPQTFQMDCHQECMKGTSDVTIIGSMLHTHALGTRIRSNIFKDGQFVREFARTDFWNFGYQGIMPVQAGEVLRQGEYPHLTCEYVNTRGVEQKLGLGSEDEMCLAAMVYYPRKNLGIEVCGPQKEQGGKMVAGCETTDGSQSTVDIPSTYPLPTVNTDGPIKPLFGAPVCTAAPSTSAPAVPDTVAPVQPQQNCRLNTLATADDYKVCWETDVAQNTITLTLTVQTNGWIGFGIAENTSSWMPGSDIATVEWGAQGEAILTDRYAVDQTAPQADPCGPEEWQMENFQRANGVVTGVLKRKLIITDTQTDRSILPGSQRVILAYGTSAMMGYHSARKSVAFPFVAGGVPEDSTHDKSVDLRTSFAVPTEKTTYTYYGFDLMQQFPEMKTSKHQIVGFEFIDDDVGKAYEVHHVVVQVCKRPQNFTHGVTLTVPEYAAPETGPKCASDTQMYLWAPGRDTYYLPKEAGFTVTDVENRYIFLGYHYDNSAGTAGIVDTSGVRIKITSTARQHDVGVMVYGDFNLARPWVIAAVTTPQMFQMDCPQECIESSMTADVTVIGSMLHAHSMGRRIRSNIFKDGQFVREFARTDFWNFGYQGIIPTQEYETLRNGESLHLTCQYVNDRGVEQKFGLGSQDEMCLAAVVYYPKQNLGIEVCGAQKEENSKMVAACEKTDGSQFRVDLPSTYPLPTVNTDGPIKPLFGAPKCTAAPSTSAPAGTTTAPTVPNTTAPAVPDTVAPVVERDQFCSLNTLATADDYKVCWETDVAQNTITLTLTVQTNGWIGFGIAENTSSWMPGSDIATVEWGAQGEAILTDRYAVDQTAPQADPCGPEEWQMENFQRANGVVTGVLKRKLIITDTQTDRSILPGSQRVILAYGTSAMMGYHSARKSVAFPFVAGGVPEDSTHDKSVDIKSSFVVPSAKTTYSYLGFDLMQQFPEMKTSKHQIVGFQFLAADGGLPYDVHHVVVNACKYPQNFTHGVTLTATEHAMPETGPRCASETQMYLWAPGKDTYFLPKEAGFTVTDIENRYLVLGYHYDNPQGSSGNVDTSGISIKITSTARQHEAGVLGYGDFNVHYRNTLPAVTTPQTFQMDCHQECMKGTSDVTIIGSMLHTHALGTRIRSNIFKDGQFVREFARTDFWNFGYQGIMPVQAGEVLRQGEYPHLTCEYVNTRGVEQKLGLGSEDEMCLAAMVYYPRKNLGIEVCGPQKEQGGKMVAGCETTDGTQYTVDIPSTYPLPTVNTDGPIKPLFGAPVCTAAPPTLTPTTAPATDAPLEVKAGASGEGGGDDGLSTGAIVGIVIAAIAAVLLAVGAAFFFYTRSTPKPAKPTFTDIDMEEKMYELE